MDTNTENMNTEAENVETVDAQEEANKNVEKTKKAEPGSQDSKADPCYISFSKKQIARVRDHTDPTKIDKVTGKQMQIATVRVPSKNYRSIRFGVDSNGINRDEREASINLVTSYMHENRDSNTNEFKNYFAYLDPARDYKINFKGKVVDKDKDTKKNIFDKPEQITLKGSELSNIFKESRVIAKEKWQQKQDERLAGAKPDKKPQQKKKDTKTKVAGPTK